MTSSRSSFLLILIALTFGVFELHANMLSQEIAGREKEKGKKKKAKARTDHGQTLSTMSYETLKRKKDEYIKNGDLYNASKYLEEMIRICDDHKEKQPVMIELGDVWFKQQDHKHAVRVYEEFVTLYPGSQKVGYALSQAIESSYQQILSQDRDQTRTEDTLKLIDSFMERKDVFAEYAPRVLEIQRKCLQRLFESEMNVANFYVSRGNFKAASRRFENITKKFGATLPDVQPQVLEFKITLADAQHDQLTATQARIELAQKFPTSSLGKQYANELPSLQIQLASLEQKPQTTSSSALV